MGEIQKRGSLEASVAFLSIASPTGSKGVMHKVDTYGAGYNLHLRPLPWTADANSILARLKRLCEVISDKKLERCSLDGRASLVMRVLVGDRQERVPPRAIESEAIGKDLNCVAQQH